MKKEIFVFIVEDRQLAQELIRDHFNKNQITYASIFPDSQRPTITSSLDLIN